MRLKRNPRQLENILQVVVLRWKNIRSKRTGSLSRDELNVLLDKAREAVNAVKKRKVLGFNSIEAEL